MKKNDFLVVLCSSLLILISFPFFLKNGVGLYVPSAFVAERIGKIKSTSDPKVQTSLYKSLIEKVGPVAAQDFLYKSGLPFDGQTHLLNHTVGDWLYETYGDSGLSLCRDYFLSSCYHGYVLHAMADGGEGKLSSIIDACKKGGNRVLTQCSHAMGHGLLAYKGYKNLPDALLACDALKKRNENLALFSCHDGAFMENIWAVHESGIPSKDRWLSEDFYYPCNEPKIDEVYRNACWSNQPMRIYQMSKGNLVTVGQICESLENPKYQRTCFDGTARQIHPITKGDIDEVFKLCANMPGVWNQKCVISIAKSAFGVGDRDLPQAICSRLSQESQKECFRALALMIVSSANNVFERISWCNLLLDVEMKRACFLGGIFR